MTVTEMRDRMPAAEYVEHLAFWQRRHAEDEVYG
jgi:hypothetical protein